MKNIAEMKGWAFLFFILAPLTFMGSAAAQAATTCSADDITCSPVGWWQFNEGSGTTAIDSSGNGNTGTEINGPTYKTGKTGGALDFNGSNQYVSVPNSSSLQVGSNFTIAAWIYPTNLSSQSSEFYSVFSTRGSNNAGSWQLGVGQVTNNGEINANTVMVTAPDPGYADTLINCGGTGTISTNTWQHVVYVHTSGTGPGTLYINGSAITSSTICNAAYTIANNSSPLLIGSLAPGANQSFSGCLDDVRIYNQALSASEVNEIYENGASGTTTTCGPVPTPHTYYVSPLGNDANSGTSAATPWQTLAKATSMAYNPGDTVNIAGTFSSESLIVKNSGTAVTPITFHGNNALLTYPDASYGVSPIINALGNYIVFDGLKVTLPSDPYSYNTFASGYLLENNDVVQNCELYGIQGNPSRTTAGDTFAGFQFDGNYNKVSKCSIHDNDNIDISRVYGSYNDFANNTLVNDNNTCYLCNNGTAVQHADIMQTISWDPSYYNPINNDIIEDNTVTNSGISGGMFHCDIDNTGVNTCNPALRYGIIIRNNVFDNAMQWEQDYFPYMEVYNNVYYNDCGGAPIFLASDLGFGAQIYNNAFIGCGIHDEDGTYGGGNTKEYNAFDPQALTHDMDQTYDSTTITIPEASTNSLFVNPAAGNFHLQAASALIGKGINLSTITNTTSGLTTQLTTDKDGNARPSSGTWDIGPYEYTPSGPAYYTITYSAGANGSISTPGSAFATSGSVSLVSGGNQPFIITPNTGYQVSSVSVDGTPDPTFNPTMFTYTLGYVTTYIIPNVTANHTIAASFVPITPGTSSTYTLTVTPSPIGGISGAIGTITSSPAGISCGNTSTCIATFNAGTNVTLTSVAASGYVFSGWSGLGAGVCSGTGTCTVPMTANQSVTAIFTYTESLSVSTPSSGTIISSDGNINCTANTPNSCSDTVIGGTNVTLNATAANGETFTGWTISGSPAGPCSPTGSTSCIIITMNTATSVTANFVPTSSIMFGDVNGDGKVNMTDAELTAQYAIGMPVTPFNITAAKVSSSGKVDMYDAYLIANCAQNDICNFPAQE